MQVAEPVLTLFVHQVRPLSLPASALSPMKHAQRSWRAEQVGESGKQAVVMRHDLHACNNNQRNIPSSWTEKLGACDRLPEQLGLRCLSLSSAWMQAWSLRLLWTG